MRGAWLVVVALSLARANKQTPLPADPELNAKWLADFRRDLLRDSYDYETDQRPSPSILGEQPSALSLYLTRAAENTSSTPRADHSHNPFGLDRDASSGPASARRDSEPAGHVSDKSDPLLDPPEASTVRHRPRADRASLSDTSREPEQPDQSDSPYPKHTLTARYELNAGHRPLARYAVNHSKNKHHDRQRHQSSETGSRDAVTHISSRPSPVVSRKPSQSHDTSQKSAAPGLLDEPPGGSSGTSLARHEPDEALVGHVSVKPPAHSLDDAPDGPPGGSSDESFARHPPDDAPVASPGALDDTASREFGISRRDLYGGQGGSLTDRELDLKRRPFLDALDELDEQMRPVVVRRARGRARGREPPPRGRSRKRAGGHRDRRPYIIDPSGLKRYRVHIDPRERFQNQFGGDEPWFKEDWGFGESDNMLPSAHGTREDREHSEKDREQREDESENRQESGDRNSGQEREADGFENRREKVRSRYVQNLPSQYLQDTWPAQDMQDPQDARQDPQDARQDPQDARQDPQEARQDPQEARQDPQDARQDPQDARQDPQEARQDPQDARQDPQDAWKDPQEAGQDAQWDDYTRRFAARRDAGLLADGLASSSRPCPCATDRSHVVPDL